MIHTLRDSLLAETDFKLSSDSQMSNMNFDISRSGEKKAVANIFKVETDALLAKKKATLCKATPGLDTAQFLPGHISLLISAILRDYSVYELCRHHLSDV